MRFVNQDWGRIGRGIGRVMHRSAPQNSPRVGLDAFLVACRSLAGRCCEAYRPCQALRVATTHAGFFGL